MVEYLQLEALAGMELRAMSADILKTSYEWRINPRATTNQVPSEAAIDSPPLYDIARIARVQSCPAI